MKIWKWCTKNCCMLKKWCTVCDYKINAASLGWVFKTYCFLDNIFKFMPIKKWVQSRISIRAPYQKNLFININWIKIVLILLWKWMICTKELPFSFRKFSSTISMLYHQGNDAFSRAYLGYLLLYKS